MPHHSRQRPAEPPLTAGQLQIAYRELRRPGWPNTLDAALLHATWGPLIRALARCRQRALPTVATTTPWRPVGPPVPPTPSSAPAGKRALWRGPTFDARRAAANDRDD